MSNLKLNVMLINKYVPVMSRVLIQHVYEVPALAMPRVRETIGQYLKDRVIVNIDPFVKEQVPSLVPGVCVHTNPESTGAIPVFFTDNELDANAVEKQFKADGKILGTEIGKKTYTIHGYFSIPIYDIFAVVNSVNDEPKTEAKAIILVN